MIGEDLWTQGGLLVGIYDIVLFAVSASVLNYRVPPKRFILSVILGLHPSLLITLCRSSQ